MEDMHFKSRTCDDINAELKKIEDICFSTKKVDNILYGLDLIITAQWFTSFKEQYQNDSFVLWHFRTFNDICEYIDPEKNPDISHILNDIAAKVLSDSFVNFIKKRI